MEKLITVSKNHQHSLAVKVLYLITGIMLTIYMLGMHVLTSHAEGALSMTTPYSDITAQAGDSLSFDLDMLSSQGTSNAKLSVANIPDGWSGYFKGGNYQISSVSVTDKLPETVPSFNLDVPATAKEGSYKISLLADAGNGVSTTLDLNIAIKNHSAGQSTYTIQYPEQEGAAGTAFTFSGTLDNKGVADSSYHLSTQAPSGWTVAYKPSDGSSQVNSINVKSGASETLSISVTPPSDVAAGDYNISLGAVSSSETLSTKVKVTITGTYNLAVSTPNQVLSMDAYSNHKSDITMSITNNGNVALNNIALSSSGPDNWKIEFDKDTIDTLAAGQTKKVVCHVTPNSSAITGDYMATIKATTSNTTASADVRVTVKTRTIWGVIAVVLILAVCGGLGYVVKKYGRR
jgi:uncharacterized membrane protein